MKLNIKLFSLLISGVLIFPNLLLVSFAETPITSQGSSAATGNANPQSPEDKIVELVCPSGSTKETETNLKSFAVNSGINAAINFAKLLLDPKSLYKNGLTTNSINTQEPISCSRPAANKSDCDVSRGEQPVIGKDNITWKCYTAPTSITRAAGATKGIKQIEIEKYNSVIPIPCQNLPGISNLNCAADYSTPAQYILRLYQFALLLVGMAAFGQIVFGGLEYILAAGSFTKIESAKGRIRDALSGMLLLLGAYFVLYNINPDLVSLREPDAPVLDIRKEAAQAQQNLQSMSDAFTGSQSGTTDQKTGEGSLCARSLNTGVTVNTNIRFDGIQYMTDQDKLVELAKPADPLNSVNQYSNTCLSCQPNSTKDSSGICQCNSGYEQSGNICILSETNPEKICNSRTGYIWRDGRCINENLGF